MGFKNTFEIITKDIQDIEKMVGNFKNYSEIPNIELDLVLSKLRNLYDVLLMVKEDNPSNADLPKETTTTEKVETAEKKPASEPVIEEKLIDIKPENTIPETENNEESVTHKEETKNDTIIADKFEKHQKFFDEKLASETSNKDLSSRLKSQPIKSIAGSIGINDKFMLIRELFNGDADKFRTTMEVLDRTDSFSNAKKYIDDNFNWDMENENVSQLMNLIERKYIISGNE